MTIKPRKVLLACEESGRVTKAMREREREIQAWSCDLLPTRGNPDWHIQGDAIEVMNSERWDMVIAFPPCDHLCVSGARWFKEKQADGRQQQGIDFFVEFVHYAEKVNPSVRMAIENPVGIMSRLYRQPNQIIQPYMFGENASKKTCLWLFNLPLLKGTKHFPSVNGRWANQAPCGADKTPPGPNRSRDRAVTYQGIADAMARQWGDLL